MKLPAVLILTALILAVESFPVHADTQPLSITYTVNAVAKLTLSPQTLNFPDSDPTYVPLVSANENPIQVSVKIKKDPSSSLTATLTCQGGPLVSGTDSIPAGNITWTATGSGLTSGALNSSFPQQVGNWTASGNYSGTLSFQMKNLWTYSVGSYTGTIVYTLTAP